jgi:hypothetical protein
MKRSHGRVDANSSELDSYAESIGISIIKCSEYAKLGFDRIYLYRGHIYIVEYKNPSRKWDLTDTEANRQELCLKAGVPYCVVEYPAHVAALIGIPYSFQATLDSVSQPKSHRQTQRASAMVPGPSP